MGRTIPLALTLISTLLMCRTVYNQKDAIGKLCSLTASMHVFYSSLMCAIRSIVMSILLFNKLYSIFTCAGRRRPDVFSAVGNALLGHHTIGIVCPRYSRPKMKIDGHGTQAREINVMLNEVLGFVNSKFRPSCAYGSMRREYRVYRS